MTETQTIDGLDDQQAEAVLAQDPELVILAGAGSGKTRVIVHRIKRLIDDGAEPGQIMCLTFSRRAAYEMTRRLVDLYGGDDQAREFLAPLMMGTFHSVALGLLQQHGHLLGFREGEPIAVYRERTCDLLFERVVQDLGHRRKGKFVGTLTADKIRRYREAIATTGYEPPDLDARDCGTIATIFSEYRSRLRRNNAADYGMLLSEALALLTTDAVRDLYRARIRHVLVDEVQDTDAVQHRIIGCLCPPASYAGIGDTRQCIYSWRGAQPRMATSEHPGARLVPLQRNYRSARRIVEAANRLIANNREPNIHPMVPARADEGAAEYVVAGLPDVVRLVERAITEQFYLPSEIAILARTNEWLDAIADCLRGHVPFDRFGSSGSIDDRDEFQAVHAALSLVVNPHDSVRFALLQPHLAIDPGEAALVRLRSHQDGVSVWDAYLNLYGDRLCPLASAIRDLQYAQPSMGDAAERVAATLDGADFVARYWSRVANMGIADALRWHDLRDLESDAPDRCEGVALSTVHGAKGLEWPVVIVVGACEDVMPNMRDGDDGLAEERRVAYVAFTRAQDRLLVVAPTVRVGRHWGSDGAPPAVPSRFIAEAGLTELRD